MVTDIPDHRHTEERRRIAQSAGGVGTFEYVSGYGTARERDQVWNNSLDLLAVLSADGLFRSVSPSWTELLGYQPEELVGHRPGEFLVDGMASDGEGLTLTAFENRYRRKDGGECWIAWRTLLENDLVYAYGRDVTQEREKQEALRQAENELRQAQKMEAVGQLTGGIAHDFNNMLTGIMGSLDIIRRRISRGQTDQIDRFMESALASAQRAASLTHRLLAFSCQQTLDPKAVDVAELIGSMEDMLRRTLGETVRLKTSAAAGLWRALSDVNQLENAVINLAINARDAMPEGGRLMIKAENLELHAVAAARQAEVKPGDYVMVSVTDTGEGMPADVLARAFDPFFTTKPIGQGTGLGLSTVYGFLRQIGGHAEIRSKPRQGTTVRMYLPRFVGEAVAEQKEEDLASRPRDLAGGRELGRGADSTLKRESGDRRLSRPEGSE